ncbi:MAG: peptidoglycan DD-metalloendopeptidase family protein [Bacteroidota bacterium]
MARIRFTYNPENCKYEPIVVTGKKFSQEAGLFICISFLIGVMGVLVHNQKYPYRDETLLQEENRALKMQWRVLNNKLERTSDALANLEQSDDQNYRVILDLEPLPKSVREAGVGGREVESATITYPLIRVVYEKVEKLKNRLDIELQSFDKLSKELAEKEKMWAARPAIQPVSNDDLEHLHTLFGLRFHPLLGYVRPHKGLDFTAPKGSPVYATGDGKVEYAEYSDSFGQVVYLNHGYNFQTRYAHLTRFIVSRGETVKRGQVIGYVGNSGLSVSPHLHYEVLYQGIQINPINFFQRDLSNKEYEKLIELGSRETISLD